MITFALPAESGLLRPLVSLLSGVLIGALAGGVFGSILGVRVPRRRRDKGAMDSRPIVVAVEADNQEEAERAEADLLNVMGPFPPKLLNGPGLAHAAHGLH